MLYQKLLLGTDPYFFSVGKGIPFQNHRHPEIELSFCMDGGYTVVTGGRERRLKKGDLARAAEISSYWMSKLNHDEPVQMEVMLRLCKVFHCDIGDLMEVIEE